METVTVKLLTPTEILVTGSDALVEWRESHSLLIPGHEYMPRFKSRQWDGMYHPGRWCRMKGDRWEMRCSRGLLGRLQETFEIPWHEPATTLWTHPQLETFRGYQQEAFHIALFKQWGRIALATNAGKGAVIALLAEYAIQHNTEVLILCDELAVFEALTDELYKWTSCTPGFISANVREPPTDPIVLAMVPTLSRRLQAKAGVRSGTAKDKALKWCDWVGNRGMVLLDEADKATAKGWSRILANAKSSHWRLGFSGSFPNPKEKPYDDLILDELMGHVLISARNIDLIKQKVSAKPLVALHRFDATNTLLNSPKRWWEMRGASRRQAVYELAIMNNVARHAFVASLIRPDTATAIVVNRVAHGQALADFLPEAKFLDGSCAQVTRNVILEDFEQGYFKVLIITKILDRGTNRLGHAADILFASGEGSTRQTLQRIGRGLRRTGGKEFLRLVDIIDRVDLDSVPTRRGFLTKAADYIHTAGRKRIQLYKDEGFDVEIIL